MKKKWCRVTISLRMGEQGPSTPYQTPIPTPYTQTYTKSIQNACSATFQLDHYGRIDGSMDQWNNRPTEWWIDKRTDKAFHRVACLQLKKHSGFLPPCSLLFPFFLSLLHSSPPSFTTRIKKKVIFAPLVPLRHYSSVTKLKICFKGFLLSGIPHL